jgi:glycosyltransferase involved in cell wall biosynthesis
MPVYNGAKFIRESIDSILGQSFVDFEFLIINDASTDGTTEILNSYSDKRIRIISNDKNEGIVNSRNRGLKFSNGEYIAMLDADDIAYVDRLSKQVAYLDNNPSTAVITSFLELINENGDVTGTWREDIVSDTSEKIKGTMPVINCIGQSTVMGRKEVLMKFGYNKSYYHSEDWGLWLNILSADYLISKIPEVLVKYRVHEESVTVKENKKSIQTKILRFKLSYLFQKAGSGSLTGYDSRVYFSMIKDFFKWIIPTPILNLLRGIRKKPWLAIMEMISTNSKLRKKVPVNNIFFFPFYHTGGAEKVHASILESVKDKSSVTFITGFSNGKAMLQDFKSNSEVIEVPHLIRFNRGKKWLLKRIQKITEVNPAVVFGCNSKYFYELIPHLSASSKCIDLVHAFVHVYEDGPEKWSIDLVSRLDARVVINQKTKKDFERLYIQKNIPVSLVSRIIQINNFTDVVDFKQRDMNGKIQALYVGRGGEEKRIEIIAEVASVCQRREWPVEIHFIGDVEKFIPYEFYNNCILHGEIRDMEKLANFYDNAHMLLLSSSREGFPLVIMEAMMHGVVPVSTNVGGISEHVFSGENGFLINENASPKIVEEFIRIINDMKEDRDNLNWIMQNAHDYAMKNFRKEEFISSYRKLLTND